MFVYLFLFVVPIWFIVLKCYISGLVSDIYFQVNNDEDIMQSLTSENNFVVWTVDF